MARIAGINIPPHQHAEIGLTAIFGIGRTRARKICEAAGVPLSKKVKDLNDAELERIREHVGVFAVEGDLRREVQLSIKRLIWVLIAGCAISAACPFAVNALAPTPAPARDRVALLQA